MSDRSLVIFDFDGTLADSQAVLDRALAEFSIARSLSHDPMKMAKGYVDPSKNDLGWGVPLHEQQALLIEYNHFMERMHRENEEFQIPFFNGVKEQLEIVYDRYDVAIVTARRRDSFLVTLQQHDLTHRFPVYRTFCCAEERGYAIKPQPDALFCVLKQTGHKPENVLMIGDTTSDILMANNAGVKSLAVLWGAHGRDRLDPVNPTHYVENISDFAAAIDATLMKKDLPYNQRVTAHRPGLV